MPMATMTTSACQDCSDLGRGDAMGIVRHAEGFMVADPFVRLKSLEPEGAFGMPKASARGTGGLSALSGSWCASL
jgi:hypothetical protein